MFKLEEHKTMIGWYCAQFRVYFILDQSPTKRHITLLKFTKTIQYLALKLQVVS